MYLQHELNLVKLNHSEVISQANLSSAQVQCQIKCTKCLTNIYIYTKCYKWQNIVDCK